MPSIVHVASVNENVDDDHLRDSRGDPVREKRRGDGLDERPRPGGVCFMYARILARFWYVICLLVFITVGAYSALSLTAYKLPDFSNPAEGFEARGTVIKSRFQSLNNLLSDDEDLVTSLPLAVEDSQLRVKRQSGTDAGVQFCYSIESWSESVPVMVFEKVGGGNTLTSEVIKSVCTTGERLITSHPSFMANCLCVGTYADRACPSTWSLGNYIALFSNKSSCADIVDEDVLSTIAILKLCAPFVHNRTRAELQNATRGSTPAECSQYDFAVKTVLHYLLPTDFTQRILEGATPLESQITAVFYPIFGGQRDALQTIFDENIMPVSYEDGITTVKAVDFFIKFRLFSSNLFADTLYMGIGVGLVFFLIWVYTGSFLVTLAALFNMIFSLVLGYFFFTVVFARPFFPFGNIMTVILIIGVGADDTFVFMDLWKQSRAKLGTEDLPLLVYETLLHASVTMFVTSVTTAAALFATVISDIIVVKCFAVFAGTAIMMNFVLTLTLLPAVIVMQHKIAVCCCRSRMQRSTNTESKCTSCLNTLFKPVRVIFERVIPCLVSKLRYLWIALFTLLMIGGAFVIFFQPQFQLPSNSELQFFASSHLFEQYDFVYKDQFPFSEVETSNAGGTIIWGVQAVDNGDHWKPGDWGTLVLDDSFQFYKPKHQTWLMNFCTELRNQSFVNPDDPVRCFIENFKDYMEMSCTNPSTGEDASPCCNQTGFPYDPALFDICLNAFATRGLFPELFFRRNSSELAVISVSFSTTYPSSYLYASNDAFWKSVNPWVEEKINSAPDSLQDGWFISKYNFGLLFYDLQQSLASGTQISMVITLAIASGILLVAIQNVLITICAMVTITSAVFVTVASLVLLGWELNIVEATIITLAVGLSVDFTIHYGVAFKLSPSSDRNQRTRYSLTTMTAAITIAALSTFIAGALVLPAVVLIYYQFGVFLMLVVSVSWGHGTFFFQSLCITIGPQGSCGDVPCLPCCECCRLGNKPKKVIKVKPSRRPTVTQTHDNPLARNIAPEERVQSISSGLVDAAPVEGSLFLVQNNRTQANGQTPQGQNGIREPSINHHNRSVPRGHRKTFEPIWQNVNPVTREQYDRHRPPSHDQRAVARGSVVPNGPNQRHPPPEYNYHGVPNFNQVYTRNAVVDFNRLPSSTIQNWDQGPIS